MRILLAFGNIVRYMLLVSAGSIARMAVFRTCYRVKITDEFDP
jgi:hypothetical protein